MNQEILPLLALMAGAIIIGIGLLIVIAKGQTSKQLNKEWYRDQWKGITQQAEDGAAGRQLAIINADKLLDRAMRENGFRGDNMGERLKKRPSAFTKLNDVWAAHKLRNKIAHESNIEVSTKEANRALAGLEMGLKDLGAL